MEDVDRKFSRLEQLQAAGWRDTAAPVVRAAPAPAKVARKPPAARLPAVKKAGPSAALRAAMMGQSYCSPCHHDAGVALI